MKLFSLWSFACFQSINYPVRREFDEKKIIYLDISIIYRHDAGTGIQRVVRSILEGLIEQCPENWELVPVGADRRKSYGAINFSGLFPDVEGRPLVIAPGDVWFGLDLSLATVARYRRQLERVRDLGGEVWFLVHDLLPLEHPSWFPRRLAKRFKSWFRVVDRCADGIFFVSRDVQAKWQRVSGRSRESYRGVVIPVGAELFDGADVGHSSMPSFDGASSGISFILMVGTVEPRKGYSEVLDAFEVLWQEHRDFGLVIVGRPGWKTEYLQKRIRGHPHLGKHLFWFDDCSDSQLEILYQRCFGLLAASYAEGFGLPIREALLRGRPVLARDIGVFREHMSYKGVSYFPSASTPEAFAALVKDFMQGDLDGPIDIESLPSWRDAVQCIIVAFSQRH